MMLKNVTARVLINFPLIWPGVLVFDPSDQFQTWPRFYRDKHSKQVSLTVWGIHVTKWLSVQSLLLVLAPHQVGFLEYLDLHMMKFVQIKRRVRGKSSSFWWCKRYSAIWSNSREHSENVFYKNSCALSR